MSLSAVVIAKNEEEKIRACLDSLAFADEVIVIDDYSEDETFEIAKETSAKVFKRRLGNNFAAQRNFGLSKASGDWVLFVDADEVIPQRLADEIIQVIENPFLGINGFYLKRSDFLWGKKLKFGETGKAKFIRLAKKGKGEWQRRVHEVWEVRGKTATLKNAIEHTPHQSVKEFVLDLNRQTTLHALANNEEGKSTNLVKILFFPVLKFLNNFFIKAGFLDGVEGFLQATFMSFHSFLAWSKLWLIQKKQSQL